MTKTLTLLILLAPAMQAAERIEDVARDRGIRREADRVQGLHLLNQGRALESQGRLEEAEASLKQALALLPSSREVREELEAVRSALGAAPDRRHEILTEMARIRSAREDQQKVEVEGRIREAGRLMASDRNAEAVRILTEAREQARWMDEGADRDRARISLLLEQAQRQAVEEAALRRQALVEEAVRAAALEMESFKAQEARRLASLQEAGLEALRSGRYDEAESLARDAGDPRLGLMARERRHLDARAELKRSAAEEWRNLSELAQEQQVPYSRGVLRHPEGWDSRRQGALDSDDPSEPMWKIQLRERLRQPVHYKFDGIPFRDAKEYLESQGRIVVNIDKSARDGAPALDETPVHLTSPEGGMTLESALNYLTRQVDLTWTMRDESILVTTADGTREPDLLVQYDVRDLVQQLKDFPGPEATLGRAGEGVSFQEIDREDGEMSKDDLVEFIRKIVESSRDEAKR